MCLKGVQNLAQTVWPLFDFGQTSVLDFTVYTAMPHIV